MNKKNREPLIHISKRDDMPLFKSLLVKLLAIVIALIVCAFITALTTKLNPVEIAKSFVTGNFGSARKTWVTFQNVSILLIISLAVTPAFMMRFWNIGAEGQVLVGCLASAACMICLGDKLPNWAVVTLMVISSIAASSIWALIPAIFKAKWNTNDTLFTLMMNYIATQLVAFFMIVWENPKGSGNIGIINQMSNVGWVELGNKYLLSIICGAVLTILVYFYLKYTKHGYEIAVVGESVKTARYVGINVEKVILRTMLLSGAICGVAAFLLVGAINHTLTTTLAAGRGFTAVMVSWLAKFNPFGMIATSALLNFLANGASELATSCGLNQDFGEILTAILIFFIIGSEFFITYKIGFRKKVKEAGENV